MVTVGHNARWFIWNRRPNEREKRLNSDRKETWNATHGIVVGHRVICHRGVSDCSDVPRPLWHSHSARTEMFFADAMLSATVPLFHTSTVNPKHTYLYRIFDYSLIWYMYLTSIHVHYPYLQSYNTTKRYTQDAWQYCCNRQLCHLRMPPQVDWTWLVNNWAQKTYNHLTAKQPLFSPNQSSYFQRMKSIMRLYTTTKNVLATWKMMEQ